jgi:hypothetical protein
MKYKLINAGKNELPDNQLFNELLVAAIKEGFVKAGESTADVVERMRSKEYRNRLSGLVLRVYSGRQADIDELEKLVANTVGKVEGGN